MSNRKLIVCVALAALSACAESPTASTRSGPRLDDGPGIGAGVGVLPETPGEDSGQLGSGNETRSGGILGSGTRTQPTAPADDAALPTGGVD